MSTPTCFGLYDKKEQPCLHCHVSRKCDSFRTTHGEQLEADFIEAILAVMTEEEVALSPLLEILEMGPEKALTSLDGICPECNSALRQRLGKHGPFIGCTSYPTCKYTRPVGKTPFIRTPIGNVSVPQSPLPQLP